LFHFSGHETKQGVPDAKDEARIAASSRARASQNSRNISDEENVEKKRIENQSPRGRKEAQRKCAQKKDGGGFCTQVKRNVQVIPHYIFVNIRTANFSKIDLMKNMQVITRNRQYLHLKTN
jgi:hypothetical protein